MSRRNEHLESGKTAYHGTHAALYTDLVCGIGSRNLSCRKVHSGAFPERYRLTRLRTAEDDGIDSGKVCGPDIHLEHREEMMEIKADRLVFTDFSLYLVKCLGIHKVDVREIVQRSRREPGLDCRQFERDRPRIRFRPGYRLFIRIVCIEVMRSGLIAPAYHLAREEIFGEIRCL